MTPFRLRERLGRRVHLSTSPCGLTWQVHLGGPYSAHVHFCLGEPAQDQDQDQEADSANLVPFPRAREERPAVVANDLVTYLRNLGYEVELIGTEPT